MAGTYPINGVKVREGSGSVYAPMAGAITCIPIVIRGGSIGTTNTNNDTKLTFPAGMVFKVNSIQLAALGTITSDPQVSIGTSVGGTQIVAGVNITSNLGALTLKATTISSDLYIRIANDTGDSINVLGGVTVNIIGHWQAPPTALFVRNAQHF